MINVEGKARTPVAEGHVRTILGPSDDGTRVQVAIEEVAPGKTCRLSRSDKTQVVYILEGKDAKIASESGFDYIEFQAPFDFVTTMDADPLGKNWYIKGTDDGTGKPKQWVQS